VPFHSYMAISSESCARVRGEATKKGTQIAGLRACDSFTTTSRKARSTKQDRMCDWIVESQVGYGRCCLMSSRRFDPP
jgi:hypothetical protein